jgi:putative SOS response-associated peptidase YedK
MCGRYTLTSTSKELVERFNLLWPLEISAHYNIAPSQRIPVVRAIEQGRELALLKWGLIPSWAKDDKIGNKLSNARGETVAEKPSFRSAFKSRRCLIPASGFYEWKTKEGVKYPWYISLKSGEIMAFAGLWETWHPKDGETIESCCIITTDANALMQPIHDRMPVILDPEQWTAWLSPQEHKADKLLSMIHPHNPDSMQAWPVTRELNRFGLRDDAGLIEPISNNI